MSDVTREQLIQHLRDLASFLEEHENVPVGGIHMLQCAQSKEEFLPIMRALGSCEKDYSSEKFFSAVKVFGPSVKYECFVDRREVCEGRVVGTREVPARTEEIVEWTCAESILR